MTIKFRHGVDVELVHRAGTDLTVVNAARVSFGKQSEELTDRDKQLIRRLVKEQHFSTLEHCTATFAIHAPIFVAREWMRHRTQSFNEISGRYAELEPTFFYPDCQRPIVQTGKPMDYHMGEGDTEQWGVLEDAYTLSCGGAWEDYQNMLQAGISREVARNVLPVGVYTRFYATANLRNWLQFLDLRTDQTALQEIRDGANKVKHVLSRLYPVTLEAWEANNAC